MQAQPEVTSPTVSQQNLNDDIKEIANELVETPIKAVVTHFSHFEQSHH